MSKIKRTEAHMHLLRFGDWPIAVNLERRLQDEQWGPPQFASHLWPTWMGILQREVGEALDEAMKIHFEGGEDDEHTGVPPLRSMNFTALVALRVELVQVAAVAKAISEVVEYRLQQISTESGIATQLRALFGTAS